MRQSSVNVAQVYKQKTTNSISVSFYLISIQLQNTLNDYITCNRGTKKFKRLLYDYITCNPFFTTFSSLPVEILERAGLANIKTAAGRIVRLPERGRAA
jgi:hypothetical protein